MPTDPVVAPPRTPSRRLAVPHRTQEESVMKRHAQDLCSLALFAVLLAGAAHSHSITTLVQASAQLGWSCSASAFVDCATNLRSAYSHVLGMPISAWATG